MNLAAKPLQMPVDGRQSETALRIARGTARLLHALGRCVVSELGLPSGRRADLVALDAGGEIWIVEIKSSVAGGQPQFAHHASAKRMQQPGGAARDSKRGFRLAAVDRHLQRFSGEVHDSP